MERRGKRRWSKWVPVKEGASKEDVGRGNRCRQQRLLLRLGPQARSGEYTGELSRTLPAPAPCVALLFALERADARPSMLMSLPSRTQTRVGCDPEQGEQPGDAQRSELQREDAPDRHRWRCQDGYGTCQHRALSEAPAGQEV
eukprot:1139260-Pelagomonas_calceolata.AAC.6